MTRFEENCASRIVLARTREYAEAAYARACDHCCTTGKRLECNRCAINRAFQMRQTMKDEEIRKLGIAARALAHS